VVEEKTRKKDVQRGGRGFTANDIAQGCGPPKESERMKVGGGWKTEE